LRGRRDNRRSRRLSVRLAGIRKFVFIFDRHCWDRSFDGSGSKGLSNGLLTPTTTASTPSAATTPTASIRRTYRGRRSRRHFYRLFICRLILCRLAF
jgi:hypothetical protein